MYVSIFELNVIIERKTPIMEAVVNCSKAVKVRRAKASTYVITRRKSIHLVPDSYMT